MIYGKLFVLLLSELVLLQRCETLASCDVVDAPKLNKTYKDAVRYIYGRHQHYCILTVNKFNKQNGVCHTSHTIYTN